MCLLCRKCFDGENALTEIEIDLELMHQLTKSSAVQKLMDFDFIYLLDSGGQPPFREMLPHFVQQSSAIVEGKLLQGTQRQWNVLQCSTSNCHHELDPGSMSPPRQ
jgi:hypothetical protein